MKTTFTQATAILIAMMFTAGCSSTRYMAYETNLTPENVGMITIQMTSVAKAKVFVDSEEVFDEAGQTFQLENVTPGTHTVEVIVDGDGRESGAHIKERVRVSPGETSTVVVEVPPYQTGHYVQWGIGVGVAVLVIFVL